ncbi:sigma factor [Pseudomonas brassicae]|uniref:sigma factor n=1 Tax=Pseudomonas brassicae TaxID=2708063 RepID=UPI003B75CC90
MSSHDPVLHEQVSRIYQEQHRWLRSWLRPRVDCQHLAADLVQDVFVRILGTQDASSKLRAVREPRGYLATIARRMMIDHFRRNAWSVPGSRRWPSGPKPWTFHPRRACCCSTPCASWMRCWVHWARTCARRSCSRNWTA